MSSANSFPIALPDLSIEIPTSISIYSKKGEVEIVGGLLYQPGPHPGFYGEVNVKIPKFSIMTVAGFLLSSDLKTFEAFFLYANVGFEKEGDVPPPGSPAFTLKGISGGFGVNYKLTLPTIDKVSDFPLLPGNAPTEKKAEIGGIEMPWTDPLNTIIDSLIDLTATDKKDKEGNSIPATLSFLNKQYWIAFGIDFTSYEMIDGFVLATVSFGQQVHIDLLGHFEMNFPNNKDDLQSQLDRLAHFDVDILASINPSAGLISIDGVVKDSSYIITKAIKLSGGFAFYKWFKSPYKGDFVMTAGGYHPSFDVPSHYPKVDRLECKFKMGSLETVGKAYFAFTPNVIMAGLNVECTWKSGSIKAWYNYGADFLMGWTPFHYEGSAYVHIGVSAKVGFFKVHCSAGVSLVLWGPDFGGKARISLSVISFTIKFGASRKSPTPIGWKTYRKNFLPKRKPVTNDLQPMPQASFAADSSFKTSSGQQPMSQTSFTAESTPKTSSDLISAQVVDGNQQNCQTVGFDWIFDPNLFELQTLTQLPANKAYWNNIEILNTFDTSWDEDLIIPINNDGAEEVIITHSIRLQKKGANDVYADFHINQVAVTPILEKLAPSQICTDARGFGDNTIEDPLYTIENGLMGFNISPVIHHPDVLSSIPLYDLIFQQSNDQKHFSYTEANPNSATYTVTTNDSRSGSTLDITLSEVGESPQQFINDDRVLNAMNETAVKSKRNLFMTALNAGYNNLLPVAPDLDKISKKALTDWPIVGLLGDDSVRMNA